MMIQVEVELRESAPTLIGSAGEERPAEEVVRPADAAQGGPRQADHL